MGSGSRPDAEDFDPVSAQIYGPNRVVRTSGLPGTVAGGTLLFTTRIKPPRGLYTSERMSQQQADSRSDTIIEVWKYGMGYQLDASMWIIHRGIRYDIVGKDDMQSNWRSQTVKYQCRQCNNVSLATS